MGTKRAAVGMFAVFLVASGWLLAQDEKAKIKGQLPQNWTKLGLSDEQKQKVYDIRGEYKGKIEALESQIKELRAKEGSELAKVLTAAQKTRLKEIVAAKALSDPPEKDDKKGDKK